MSELLQPMLEFNFRPLRYMHDSWLEEVPGAELVARLRACARSEDRLSAHVLEHFGLAGHYVFEFSDFSRQLVFMPTGDLARFIHYLGVVLNAEALRRSIDGNDVRRIHEYLERDMYLFGLRRAPYIAQVSDLPQLKVPPQLGLGERIVASGMQCLRVALNSAGAPVVKRLLLKFPKLWCRHINHRFSAVNAQRVEAFMNEIYLEVIQP